MNTGIRVTTDGSVVLGSPIGSESFMSSFITEKVTSWCIELVALTEVALVQPQAAFCAFTHGLCGRWTFFRTCQLHRDQLKPLEDIIHCQFIPSLTGRDAPNDLDRDWFSLPYRFGGLGLINPCCVSLSQYQSSLQVTDHLVDLLFHQEETLSVEVQMEQQERKKTIQQDRSQETSQRAQSIRDNLPEERVRLMDVACERGASSWLSALPLHSHGFDLHKGMFRDALCIRYGWRPPDLPGTCVCGSSFTVTHALSCPYGGYPIRRHNDLRNLTATLLREICTNVTIEPHLQPLTGEHLDYRTANREDNAGLM